MKINLTCGFIDKAPRKQFYLIKNKELRGSVAKSL
jgi:hypothetical protein